MRADGDRKKGRLTFSIIRVILGIAAILLIITGINMLFDQFTANNSMIRDIAKESLRDESEHRVLFLSSYSQSHFSVPLQWKGIDEEFEGSKVTLDTEYMDTKNHPDERSLRRFTNMLSGKLATTHYDVLIVGDDNALAFADAHRDDLFKDVPVVFLGINDLGYAERAHQEGWATGIPEESNFADVFHTAAGLFPDCKKFVCIVDDSPTGQGDLAQLQQIESQFPDHEFQVINSSQLSKDDYIRTIEAIDDQSVIFDLDAFRDADGNTYSIDDTCRLLSSHSTRPVFRASTGGVGNGALCSGFLDFKGFGRDAAHMSVQIMSGTSPADIPLVHNNQTSYVFDMKQMERFGLKDDELPQHSTVINERRPLWEQYRSVLIPVLHIVLGLVVTIISLVISTINTSRDAKRLRESEQKLRHELYYDTLTDLINRNGLFELYIRPYRTACTVNIDGFKFINEKYGHSCGDQILKTVAERLSSIRGAKAARLGGDEFFVLFRKDLSEDHGEIERFDALMHEPYQYQNQLIDVSLSVGLALREGDEPLDELLTKAELAMYESRRTREHHGLQIYNEKLRKEIDQRSALVSVLQHAVRDDSFSVVYQPQVDTTTGELNGFEALCRLQDNRYYPGQFIPVAEESGLIIQIDRIVTRKVIEQMASWKQEGLPLPVVSINYSARQLRDRDYCGFLAELLCKYDIPTNKVKVEITETSVFSDRERSDEFFAEADRMGILLALDDYGTGYSSITAVTNMPVTFVKFDKSLIDEYLVEGRLPFLDNLTAIVHDLGKKVIAEGVETKEQYLLAKQIGIDQIQGYYFGRPVPADEAARYLSSRPM